MATFEAGAKILAATHEELVDAWDTYVVSWTASTAPAIGNGTLSGRYKAIGKLVTVWIGLTPGTTTTFGGGQWNFSLPVTPNDPGTPFDGFTALGHWKALDGSASVHYHGPILRSTGSTVINMTNASGAATATMTATVPFTWAASTADHLRMIMTYEAA